MWLGDGEGGPTVDGSDSQNAVASFDPAAGVFRLYAFRRGMAGLVVGADGKAWVGGHDITRVDPSGGRAARIRIAGTVVAAGAGGSVWAVDEARCVLCEVGAKGKKLGVYQFPEQKTTDTFGPPGSESDSVWVGPDLSHAFAATAVDATGRVWMATPDGLWSVQPR